MSRLKDRISMLGQFIFAKGSQKRDLRSAAAARAAADRSVKHDGAVDGQLQGFGVPTD